jgi:branched-chain amino acid transport system substrate-binding protein
MHAIFKSKIAVLLSCLSVIHSYSATKSTLPDQAVVSAAPAIAVDHAKEIVFGQSGSFSGHFGLYGSLINHGILACFERANKQGGVQGKKLRLVSMDDHGETIETKSNIEKMFQEQGITMFTGVMGTQGVVSVLPLIKAQKISVLFPWGGNEKLRDTSLTNLVNGLGFMEPQIDVLVDYVANKLHYSKVAIFHADDNFSTSVVDSMTEKLKAQNIVPVGVSKYNRFTLDIIKAADQLIETDPKVVICASMSMPATKLINRFFEKGHFGTIFVGIDSTSLVPDILHDRGINFKYASAVPDPKTSLSELAKNYREDMARYYPNDGITMLSFAYYMSTSMIVQALQKIKGPITQDALIKNIESMQAADLQGVPVTFDAKTRHAFGTQALLI